MKGLAVVEKDNYFENGKEFRFVMEWAPEKVDLRSTATRDSRVGFFVPI